MTLDSNTPGTEAPESSSSTSPEAPAEWESPEDHLLLPDNPLPPVQLDDLPTDLQEAARKLGWDSLMPVQRYTIPYLLDSARDLMIQSRTGSGKTGAFILPALLRADPTIPHCQVLILVPTRELAQQVTREAERLSEQSGLRVVTVIGGVAYGPQLEAFRQGAHIVVGTPGRILDHLQQGSLDLDDLQMLIFDEADKMLSMGFYPDMVQMKRFLPSRRSSAMFSATYTASVLTLAREFLQQPGFLSLSRDKVSVDQIHHVLYEVDTLQKDSLLCRLIELEAPTSAIIFCNTKDRVAYVTSVLQRHGYNADAISADLNQKQRERVLEKLRDGSLRFLVATDLAGRGIDIPALSHVVLYEFPDDPENYIHRAGRTGRAGSDGVCISLVALREMAELERTARKYNIQFDRRPLPTDDDVEALMVERVVEALDLRLRSNDHVARRTQSRFLALAAQLGSDPDLHPILALLLNDYYQQSVHGNPPPDPIHVLGAKLVERSARASAPARDNAGSSREGGDRPRKGQRDRDRSGRGNKDRSRSPRPPRPPKPGGHSSSAPQALEQSYDGTESPLPLEGEETQTKSTRRRRRGGRGKGGSTKPETTMGSNNDPGTSDPSLPETMSFSAGGAGATAEGRHHDSHDTDYPDDRRRNRPRAF
jgi:ATP-dependent RNA helicase DeaD